MQVLSRSVSGHAVAFRRATQYYATSAFASSAGSAGTQEKASYANGGLLALAAAGVAAGITACALPKSETHSEPFKVRKNTSAHRSR